MNIGWPLVGIMVIIVGLAMAEVCSSYPTAGGLYYWSAKLGGKNGPAWSWFTGWFNLLGQVAVTAGIDGGLALFASAFMNNWFGYPLDAPISSWSTQSRSSSMGCSTRSESVWSRSSMTSRCGGTSSGWSSSSPCCSSCRSTISPSAFIFTSFQNGVARAFPGSVVYVFLIGLLLAQYTFTGYDASAHMTEETKNAAIAGPRGHRAVDRRVAVRRLDLAHRCDIGDPELRRRVDRRCPGRADLHRRGRRWPRAVPAADRDRRAVLLRHVIGDR